MCVQPGVLALRLLEAANHEDRQVRPGLSQRADKMRTVHAGHDVVGDHRADLGREPLVVDHFEGANRVEGRKNEVSGPPEDGLANRRLDGVVVDDQDRVSVLWSELPIGLGHWLLRSPWVRNAARGQRVNPWAARPGYERLDGGFCLTKK